jgi:hypothetical protein
MQRGRLCNHGRPHLRRRESMAPLDISEVNLHCISLCHLLGRQQVLIDVVCPSCCRCCCLGWLLLSSRSLFEQPHLSLGNVPEVVLLQTQAHDLQS